MIDIKEKIRELCKEHVEDSIEDFLNKYSTSYLYDNFIKDMFVESDDFKVDDNHYISLCKHEDTIEYALLDYAECDEDNGDPKELNRFTLKNTNPNPTGVFFG